jgi:uncharacterized protein (TIGR02246 family)
VSHSHFVFTASSTAGLTYLAFQLLNFAVTLTSGFSSFGSLRRVAVISAVSTLFFLSASAQSVGSGSTQGKNPDGQKLITASLEKLVTAWNTKNSDSISQLFLADAVLVLPSGNMTRSRANIRRRLMSEWQGKLKNSKLAHSVEAVSFEGSEAIVKGKYKLDGVTILGFKTEGPFVVRQKQQQGRWLIARAEILPNPD